MTIEILKIPFKDIEECGMSLKDKDNSWSLKRHAEAKNADIAVNGAMFSNGNPKTDKFYYWNIVDMVLDGKFNRGGNYSNKGIAFGKPFAGISAYPSTTENCINKPVDFVAGAPTLIINGTINMDMKGLQNSFATGYTNRTAIGVDDYNLYIATTRAGHHTLKQVAQALTNAGCKNSINLDGGGSTAIYNKTKGKLDYYTQGRNVTSAFYVKKKKRNPKVILDAGHSTLVSGKQSPDGTYKEYEFNLDVVNRMEKLLTQYPLEVVFVDYSHANANIELTNLINKINAETADICVSIHSNAYGAGFNNANGWEIYSYGLKGEGFRLAEAIHREMPVLGLTDRGIKDGSHLAMVRDTKNMYTVLIETGFHTNLSDLVKLKSPSFRDLVAKAYVKGILKYLNIPYIEPVKEPLKIYRVQVGAFSNETNAEALLAKLKDLGFSGFIKEE